MASPVNIRVVVSMPFPALVVGGAPVKVTKANGIWTIALDVHDLTTVVPLASAYPTDYLILWDDVALTYGKVSLTTLGLGGVRVQRAVSAAVATAIVVAGNDQIINFNSTAAAMTCTLPAAATRNGMPLTFKDAAGKAGNNNLVFSFTGADKADGLGNGQVSIANNYGEITFTPYNDGTNTGWAIS